MAFVRICDCNHKHARIINDTSPFGSSAGMSRIEFSVFAENNLRNTVSIEMCPFHFRHIVDYVLPTLDDGSLIVQNLRHLIGEE